MNSMARFAGLALTCGWASVFLTACELDEITVVDVEDVVVAEVYVDLASDPANNRVSAFLHRTLGVRSGGGDALANAVVTITRSDGFEFTLTLADVQDCITGDPDGDAGACFLADPVEASLLSPGDLFEVEVATGGRTILGSTRVPGGFELDGLPRVCRLEPNTLLSVRWTRSERAWAYFNETSIRDLSVALAPEGIDVEDDPLYLLGVSVSDTDTMIVFPSEFGVFNRFDLEQDLSVRLQRGLPEGVRAEVSITAADRNSVNWARGGNFNPSGQVRVPSLRGGGTGVFGSTVSRRFNVVSTSDLVTNLPDCPAIGSIPTDE